MPRKLPEPAVDEIDLTTVLSALVDPARRTMMRAMYRSPDEFDCAASVWGADLGLGAPTISHHFRILREAGLTSTTVDGRSRTICVRRADIEKRFPGLLDAVLSAD